MNWISIEERLPGKGERVLLYTPYSFFGRDHSCVGDAESIVKCTTGKKGAEAPIFTHWMQLPQFPAGRVGKGHKEDGGDSRSDI